MLNKIKTKSILYKVAKLVLTKDDKRIILVILASVLMAAIEVVGVTAVVPFMSMVSDPSVIQHKKYFISIYQLFNFADNINFIIFFGSIIVAFYFIRGSYSIWYLYFKNKYLTSLSTKLSKKLFHQNIHMPYVNYVELQPATIYDVILWHSERISSSINSAMVIVVESFTCLVIYTLLFVFHPIYTLAITMILGLAVYLITKLCISKLKAKSKSLGGVRTDINEILYKTFGNFKLVKLSSNEDSLEQEFHENSIHLGVLNTFCTTLNNVPKIILEVCGFTILIGFALVNIFISHQVTSVISFLVLYSVAFYKLLPSLNNITSNYNQLFSYYSTIESIEGNLQQINETYGDSTISFNKNIELKDIVFRYTTSKRDIIDKANLIINRGEKVAFVGESGGGKSTLVNLIMGIYTAQSGNILVDGVAINQDNLRSWRNKIGYIPQHIYLFRGRVADNVSFGFELDLARVTECLKIANIYDLFDKFDGLNTIIGEGGINISGGQKQRLGIARALYSDPDVIVLDEATSALDNETESLIMDEIYRISEGKTLIIIAHRLSTVDRCDRVIALNQGCLVD